MTAHNIITATKATRTFSNLLNQVCYQGKTFDIKRGKEIIATLTPATPTNSTKIKSLNAIFKNLPALDEKDFADFNKILKESRKLKQDENPWD